MRSKFSRAVLAAALLTCGVGAAQAGTAYTFTLNQTNSSLSYSLTADAPFGSSGSPPVASTLVGAEDQTQVATEPTRTKRLASAFSPCGSLTPTQNDLITISGTIAASGSSPTPSITHPGGTFKLGVNTAAGTCQLQDLNLNLIAAGSISAAASLNSFMYQSFCTVSPGCTAPYVVPISLQVGEIDVTSLLAAQAPGVPDSGTLTASGPNSWNFSVTTTVTVTPTIAYGRAPLPAGPQQIPVTFAGTITLSGATATITASTELDYSPAATAPGALPPTELSVPAGSLLCSGINIILSLNITSSTVTSNNTATIVAAGTRLACPCDTNGDGARTVQDIFDFLALWFAGNSRADFNSDTHITVQDIFAFLSCWFSQSLGC